MFESWSAGFRTNQADASPSLPHHLKMWRAATPLTDMFLLRVSLQLVFGM